MSYVYKKSPGYNNAMSIDELWTRIADAYGEPDGYGNIQEDALALIDYAKDRNTRTSFDDLYGSQREDVVNAQVGEFLDAVQSMEDSKAASQNEGQAQHMLEGVNEDGRFIFRGNFPAGTDKNAKGDRIVRLVQQVWSKEPINLTVWEEDGSTRKIQARFDPTLTKRSDLSKIAYGNRYGNASEKRITLDLADDLQFIAETSSFSRSKAAEANDYNPAHDGVTQYHYFVNDILYVPYEGGEPIPVRMNIDVKETADGDYFYTFHVDKTGEQKRIARPTLHAAVVAENGDNDSSVSNIPSASTGVKPSAGFSLDDDYMPLAERYDAGIATDEEIAEMQRDVNEAAEAAGFPATQYDPVIYDANGNVVPRYCLGNGPFMNGPYTRQDHKKCKRKETLIGVSLWGPGGCLSSRAVASQVLSVYVSLTSVFGMGTGGTSQLNHRKGVVLSTLKTAYRNPLQKNQSLVLNKPSTY